jgi:hypothetical protein
MLGRASRTKDSVVKVKWQLLELSRIAVPFAGTPYRGSHNGDVAMTAR